MLSAKEFIMSDEWQILRNAIIDEIAEKTDEIINPNADHRSRDINAGYLMALKFVIDLPVHVLAVDTDVDSAPTSLAGLLIANRPPIGDTY